MAGFKPTVDSIRDAKNAGVGYRDLGGINLKDMGQVNKFRSQIDQRISDKTGGGEKLDMPVDDTGKIPSIENAASLGIKKKTPKSNPSTILSKNSGGYLE